MCRCRTDYLCPECELAIANAEDQPARDCGSDSDWRHGQDDYERRMWRGYGEVA